MGAVYKSLNDMPTQGEAGDLLGNMKYVHGLKNFILNASTPVTIGIQGGWGSGKTSLINMLQEQLENDQNDRTLCVVVNAWEHSLFQENDARSTVALSLLRGIFDSIISKVQDSDCLDKELVSIILQDKEQKLEKAKKAFIAIACMALRLGAAYATGSDMGNPEAKGKVETVTPHSKHIHDLRVGLADIVKKLVDNNFKNKPSRIVCFVDDLDRVPPSTAVEILDVTKNIFEIENCIFVLSIDYEVIVKGLEGKFGQKNSGNEREFRQYFDKIIQIPFTMPVGAYYDLMGKFIEASLKQYGYAVGEDDDTISNLSKVAFLATDGVPRSVKRILNTVSLLANIQSAETEDDSEDLDIEIMFIVAAIHINFQEVCRILMSRHKFESWRLEQISESCNMKYDKESICQIKKMHGGEVFDEEWEQVIFFLCQNKPWLESKAKAISNIFNILRDVLIKKYNDAEIDCKNVIQSQAYKVLNRHLKLIRVVSVENEAQSIAYNESDKKTDLVSEFCKAVHDILLSSFGGTAIKKVKGFADDEILGDNILIRSYKIEFLRAYQHKSKMTTIEIDWREDDSTICFGFRFDVKLSSARNFLSDIAGCVRGKEVYEVSDKKFKGIVLSGYDKFRLARMDAANDVAKEIKALHDAFFEITRKLA